MSYLKQVLKILESIITSGSLNASSIKIWHHCTFVSYFPESMPILYVFYHVSLLASYARLTYYKLSNGLCKEGISVRVST